MNDPLYNQLGDTDKIVLKFSTLLHDIGKLKIPDEILNKPGKYTDEEFDLVKRHTKFGYELLKPLNIDPHIKKAALLHHERCDGSGYPLKATQKDLDELAADQKFLRENGMMEKDVNIKEIVLPTALK